MMYSSPASLEALNPPPADIATLVKRCLKSERDRRLSANSLKELKRYLNEFADYCKPPVINSPEEITPEFLKNYVDQRCEGKGPTLKKAVVWSLRKLGAYLCLLQITRKNPAGNLRHPVLHPRSKLPAYLSETDLRKLLEYASRQDYRDFAVISLMTGTGLRPNEVVRLKRDDIYLRKHYLNAFVKGGWIKKTHLSRTLATILKSWLSTRSDTCDALFINDRGHPVTKSWLLKMVKKAGKGAGFSISLTVLHFQERAGSPCPPN